MLNNQTTKSTQLVKDVIATAYDIHAPAASTTPLEFGAITFAVPWSDIVKIRGVGSWNFKNGEFVFISSSTTTTKSVWAANPGIRKIVPIDSLSDYDLEKMVWESHAQDAVLLESGKAKTTDDVKNGMLASLKIVKYSWCDQLLEFQNRNDIKGVVCKWHNKEKPSVSVYFYPFTGVEYSLMFRTDQDPIIDSIISSIRLK